MVSYGYQQAERASSLESIQRFTLELAKKIDAGENLVYIDESSCNMWMRKRQTWTSTVRPVKMQLN